MCANAVVGLGLVVSMGGGTASHAAATATDRPGPVEERGRAEHGSKTKTRRRKDCDTHDGGAHHRSRASGTRSRLLSATNTPALSTCGAQQTPWRELAQA